MTTLSDTTFPLIAKMEEPIHGIRDFGYALLMMAGSVPDDPDWQAVHRLALGIVEHARELKSAHEALHLVLHPESQVA